MMAQSIEGAPAMNRTNCRSTAGQCASQCTILNGELTIDGEREPVAT